MHETSMTMALDGKVAVITAGCSDLPIVGSGQVNSDTASFICCHVPLGDTTGTCAPERPECA